MPSSIKRHCYLRLAVNVVQMTFRKREIWPTFVAAASEWVPFFYQCGPTGDGIDIEGVSTRCG